MNINELSDEIEKLRKENQRLQEELCLLPSSSRSLSYSLFEKEDENFEKFFMKHSTELFYVLNNSGEIEYANECFLKKLGYTFESAFHQKLGFDKSPWVQNWQEYLSYLEKNKNHEYESVLEASDAKKIYATIQAHYVWQKGQPFVACVAQTKEIAETTQTDSVKSNALWNIIPDVILVMQKDGLYLDVRGGYGQIAKHKIVGTSIYDSDMPGEIIDKIVASTREAIHTGVPQEIEYSLVSPDGSLKFYESRAMRYDEDKSVRIVRDVTDKKQATLAIKTETDKKNALLQAIPDMIYVVNEKGDYLDFKAGNNFGYFSSSSHIIGTNIADNHMLPEDVKKRLIQSIENTLQTGVTDEFEYHITTSSGQTQYFECRTIRYTQQSVLHIVRDISDKREAEELIRRTEEKNKALLNAIPDLIVVTSAEGRILDVQGGLEISFLEQKTDLIGKHLLDIRIPKKIVRQLLNNIKKALTLEKPLVLDSCLEMPDKSQRFFTIKTVRYTDELVINFIQDTTPTRITEIEKNKLFIETQQLNEELIANEEELRQMLEQTIQIKEVLEKREAYYKTLISSLPDIIFELDANYNIEFAHLPSQQSDNLIGTNILDWLPIENRAIVKRKFDYVLYAKEPNSFEFTHFDNVNLSARTYLAYIAPVKDYKSKIKGLYTVLKDITEIKQKENKLQELSRQLNSIIEYGIQNTVLLDIQGRVIFADTRTRERIARQTGKELQNGDYFGNYLTGQVGETFQQYFQSAINGLVVRQELQIQGSNQNTIWLDVSYSPVFDERKKNVVGVVMAELNITARKTAESKLIETNEQLVKHNTQLNHYSYVVSHNLRAPVATLLGLVKIFEMQGNQMDDILFGYFKDTTIFLDNTVGELNQMLTNTNSFERLKKIVELKPFMKAILASQSIAIENSKAQIDCEYQIECFHTVKTIFQSILENLISNAIKYRKKDSQLIIHIKFYQKDNRIGVDVSDNGLGIDLTKHGKDVFRIYKRFHTYTEGEGIGLYLVKTQVEMLGGTIWVESLPDVGTTFKLDFPE